MKKLILLSHFLASFTSCYAACELIDHGATANCSAKLLTEIPHDLPSYVTSLDVSHNPLWIDADSFLNYHGLQFLNLSHCKLRLFSYPVITDCRNLERLDLSDNDFYDVKSFGGDYFYYLPRLRTLLLAGNPLYSFPTLQSETLEFLDLQRCKIRNFNIDVIPGVYLPHLRYLNLAKNPLTSLKGLYSNSLEELNLSGTQLYTLELNLFSTALPKVRYLLFNDNVNINRPASNIIQLNSSFNNSIEVFEAERSSFSNLMHFGTMPHLTDVTMTRNEITSIGPRDLHKNLFIKSLNMAYNRISSIASGAFKNKHFLLALDLSDNQLRSISWAEELPKLIVLNVTRNPIGSLEGLENANDLVILDAAGCGLSEIPSDIFELRHITYLYLMHNDLTSLPTIKAPVLKVLDLSYNRILRLDNHWHTPQLLTLKLEGNRITAPPSLEISNQLAGTHLYLRDNPWHCSCSSHEFQAFASIAKVDGAGLASQPLCHGPSNLTGLPWVSACASTTYAASSSRRSTWLPILMGCISTLLVISIFLAVRTRIMSPTSVTTRSVPPVISSSPTAVLVPPPPPPDNSLPSYEEALLLPKPQITPVQDDTRTPLPSSSRSRSPGLCRSKGNISRSPSSNSL